MWVTCFRAGSRGCHVVQVKEVISHRVFLFLIKTQCTVLNHSSDSEFCLCLCIAHETHHQIADSPNPVPTKAVLVSTQHRTPTAMDARVFPERHESAGVLSATNPLSTVNEEDTELAAQSPATAPPASQSAPLRQSERKVSSLKRLSSRQESVASTAPTAAERPEEVAARALSLPIWRVK